MSTFHAWIVSPDSSVGARMGEPITAGAVVGVGMAIVAVGETVAGGVGEARGDAIDGDGVELIGGRVGDGGALGVGGGVAVDGAVGD